MGWKMSCYERPKVFGKKCSGHGISPSINMDVMLVPGLRLHTSASDPIADGRNGSVYPTVA